MFPSLYDPNRVGELYVPRIAEFTAEGMMAGVKPAAYDTVRRALKIIDMQNDFCFPAPIGTLSVPGALDDVRRLIEFIYRNIENITSIYATLDTHSIYQIFFPSWWRYADTGETPNPFTMISVNKKGEAVDQSGRAINDIIDPLWSLGTYLPGLKATGQYDLTIWPYHTMEGTVGRALVPALAECLAYFAAARYSQINYIAKARAVRTEQYGWARAVIVDPDDPSTGWNSAVLDAIATHDEIYVAGEARSHCVLESMKQTVDYFGGQPDLIRRIRFLDDCNSNVVVPGVDFESIVQANLSKWQRLGIELRRSTDPIV
jgi:nicotinamidase/pyrazinamidase